MARVSSRGTGFDLLTLFGCNICILPCGSMQSGRQRGHDALPHLHKEDASSIASSQQSDINPAVKDRLHTHGRDPNGEFKIWNCTGWKLVVDEINPNAQLDKELVLNFYDCAHLRL
ncbi:unnamed protein product [Rhizoctonia solani]|uniref:Uncharacterized protein n=1 Tax=Rhizoctonia solani TaxID=456999 RepID=A0A8H3E793_9AGAM|nr:unnamed protein product [Rhizoctonia solani]